MAEVKHPRAVAEAGAVAEQAWAFELRKRGFTVRAMAARSQADLGKRLSSTTVQRRLTAALDEYREERMASVAHEVNVEVAKIEDAELRHRTYLDMVLTEIHDSGAPLTPSLSEVLAVEASLGKVADRKIKLLGLDAAAKVDVSGTIEHVDGPGEELARMIEQQAARAEAIKAEAAS